MTAPTAVGPGAGAPGAVMGDGTTARARVTRRWRAARWPLGIVALVVGVGVLTSLMGARTSTVPLAPDNPRPAGARALAQILRGQGVDITYVRTVAEATAAATQGSTLLVAGTAAMYDDQVTAVADVEADVVLAGPEAYHVEAFTDGAVAMTGPFMAGPVQASCDDPDAVAAETVVVDARALTTGDPDVAVCFPATGAHDAGQRQGGYAVVDEGDRRVVVIADGGLLSNERLDDDGAAALTLRALGRTERLVWYVPSINDLTGEATGDDGLDTASALPSWLGVVGLQALLVVAVVALWRGRRLGPVVTEPLPVVVSAAETTIGRGRLYRRARAHGHAAAALRAGTARRAAARLGLPRTAGAADVIDALARATGRPSDQITGLLYGPPPTDDAGLLMLARQLDQLESEVHRT